MGDARNDTPWQQGFILNADGVVALGLCPPEHANDTIAVLISHDCDVVESSDIEPFCELLVGKVIDQANGSFTQGKSPRRLHLEFSAGTTHVVAEFYATKRVPIEKALFLAQTPAKNVLLTPDDHFTLQAWLASRYHRPVFPDEFNRRLSNRPVEVHKKLANIFKGSGTDIIAILFDLDQGRAIERDGAEDVYSLTIYIVYSVEFDSARALKTANDMASRVRQLFAANFKSRGQWHNIELRAANAMSADSVSMQTLRMFKPWNFDYLTIVEGEAKPKPSPTASAQPSSQSPLVSPERDD
ncbi:MAG: hypothetical protein JSR60_17140 [Proteobacteria bacterium]|nr:hypothetical protein [Pseudomonadota bacterium]